MRSQIYAVFMQSLCRKVPISAYTRNFRICISPNKTKEKLL
jgi:hypothetical protein